MTPTIARALFAAAVALAAAAAPTGAQPSRSPLQLLDVPYLPQSVELCGGAAAAMVMRYWGETGVYAESFADLVDRGAGGIRGEDLIRSLHTRGWQAISVAGDAALIRKTLDQRRPPITLIEDRPGRFHYVVIVGWSAGRVVLHDPARAPFRILDESAFLQAWSRSGYWTLVTLPEPRASLPPVPPAGHAPPSPGIAPAPGACAGMVEEGVRLANAGELDAARQLLELASARCPGDSAPWRELAGVHAVEKNWTAAAFDARRALERDRFDDHAARILATSLFLEGDAAGALDAWNLVGEPTIDIIDIRGLDRIRFAVAAGALGLAPQTLLTSAALQRARRRLESLPAAMGTRLSYVPGEDGLAQISAAVIERPLLPASAMVLAATALRAATDREVRVQVASPTGAGELWHGAWRWWEPRPRVSVGIGVPAPFGGNVVIDALAERETYGSGPSQFEERRRRISAGLGNWATHALRWETSLAVDRWSAGPSMGLLGSVDYRLAGDRVAIRGRTGVWIGATDTWSVGSSIDWRSGAANEGTVWVSRLAGEAVGPTAPLALWAGAGTGQGRSELLRAHPLVDAGVIRDGVFGRRLISASGEWRRWGPPIRRVVRVAPALFVDLARAFHVPEFGDRRTHVDVGGGLRVALPGSGVLRADVGRGLRDGRMAVSVGWTR